MLTQIISEFLMNSDSQSSYSRSFKSRQFSIQPLEDHSKSKLFRISDPTLLRLDIRSSIWKTDLYLFAGSGETPEHRYWGRLSGSSNRKRHSSSTAGKIQSFSESARSGDTAAATVWRGGQIQFADSKIQSRKFRQERTI